MWNEGGDIYKANNWIGGVVVILAATAGLILLYGFSSINSLDLAERGQQGDFIGGHFGPAIGSITLAIVVVTSYLQTKQQNKFYEDQKRQTETFFFRQSFMDGISLVSQWDSQYPGCPQAMRLLDYYSRVALQRDEEELFLVLNTVITREIRANLEGKGDGTFKRDSYPFAVAALERIRPLRERDARALKKSRSNPSTPSTP